VGRRVVPGQRPVGVELDVGRHLVEIRGGDDLLPLECGSAERRHGDWSVLQAFGAAPGRDDHGFEGFRVGLVVTGRRRRLRHGRAAMDEQERERQLEQACRYAPRF
jgi:hypothetical protein